jgi:hypothetical protein
MSKYIVCVASKNSGGWNHLFLEQCGDQSRTVERLCRFVFDVEQNTIVHLDIQIDGRWLTATWGQALDVQDSLVHSNAGALDCPADFGLARSNCLPRWCAGHNRKNRIRPRNGSQQLPLFTCLPKVPRSF